VVAVAKRNSTMMRAPKRLEYAFRCRVCRGQGYDMPFVADRKELVRLKENKGAKTATAMDISMDIQ
jgi:hypothetical protein